MKINEIIEDDLEEWKASKKLCKSSRPNNKLGASALSSCVAQGLRKRRTPRKQYSIKGKMADVDGKFVKSEKYGGPVGYDD
jgi:hypothetical protein